LAAELDDLEMEVDGRDSPHTAADGHPSS
jgi:hypothetical protein